MTGALRYEGNRQADFRFGDSILVTFLVFQPHKFLHCLSKGRNLTRGDNSGKTRNMRWLFFQDDISMPHACTYTNTHIRTSRNQYVPHFFKVGGIIKNTKI